MVKYYNEQLTKLNKEYTEHDKDLKQLERWYLYSLNCKEPNLPLYEERKQELAKRYKLLNTKSICLGILYKFLRYEYFSKYNY